MKRFLLENTSEIIILSIIALAISISIFLASKVENKKVRGVVVSHNVTADRYGNRTYSTLVKTEDGYVEEATDLNSYIIPVGNTIMIKVTRPLNIKFK